MEKDPDVGLPQKATLAEERKKATPGDADSWFQSEDSSDSGIQSDSEEEIQDNSIEPEALNMTNAARNRIQDQLEPGAQVEKLSVPTQRLKDLKQVKQAPQFLSFNHKVDFKYLILLKKMALNRAVDLLQIANIKRGEGIVNFHTESSKIIVRTTTKQKGSEAIMNLSNYIEDLSILHLDVRPEFAHKLENFHQIKCSLKNRKIYFIGMQNRSKKSRQLFIGGNVKYSQLKNIQQELKNYKIVYYGLKLYRNKRSYCCILNSIFQTQTVLEALFKFNRVNAIEIDTRAKDSSIKYFINTNSKVAIAPLEYEEFLYKQVKKFFVLTFLIKKEKFYPKLMISQNSPVIFKFIKDRNIKVDYLFLICEIDVFFRDADLIAKEIQKVGQSIVGARFFNYLEPNFKLFQFDSSNYIVKRFPHSNTYSMCVSAKTREGKQFYWRETFDLVLKLRDHYNPIEEHTLLDDE